MVRNLAYILSAVAIAAAFGANETSAVSSALAAHRAAGLRQVAERPASVSSPGQIEDIAKNITVLIQGVKPGSGVIIGRDRNTYYVLTAKHVVRRHSEYDIFTPEGQKYRIKTEDYPKRVKLLPGVDLAVVEFESDRDYQVATLADYDTASKEQFVFVYGWPISYAAIPERAASFQHGTLMQKEIAPLFLRSDFSSRGYELVYTNMTHKGMSGGPVLDAGGRLIGIHGMAEAYIAPLPARNGNGVSLVQPQEIFLGYSFGMPIQKFLQHPSVSSMLPKANVERSAALGVREQGIRVMALDLLRNGEFLPAESGTDSSGPELLVDRANRMLRFFNLPKAIEGFESALQADENFYRAWYGKGIVLTYWKKYDEAIAAFERALEINPEFEQARELIANIRQSIN